MVTASEKQLLQNSLQVEMKLIGKAIDQKPTGDDGSHRVGLLHCVVEGKEKPPHYDLTATTKAL